MDNIISCVVCKSYEVTPTNQMVECRECDKLYHQECHIPPIRDVDVNEPTFMWCCSSCSKHTEKNTTEEIEIKREITKEIGKEYDEESACEVCFNTEVEENNEIVFCDDCDIAVHQACYGIQSIPRGNWFCRPCEQGLKPKCILCPKSGGAMKRTSCGTGWAHLSCVWWIPQVRVENIRDMEPIIGIADIDKERWSLKCCLCKESYGACIQCSMDNCRASFHVTCAKEKKLTMDISYSTDCPNAALTEKKMRFTALCPKHTDIRKEQLPKKMRRQSQKKISKCTEKVKDHISEEATTSEGLQRRQRKTDKSRKLSVEHKNEHENGSFVLENKSIIVEKRPWKYIETNGQTPEKKIKKNDFKLNSVLSKGTNNQVNKTYAHTAVSETEKTQPSHDHELQPRVNTDELLENPKQKSQQNNENRILSDKKAKLVPQDVFRESIHQNEQLQPIDNGFVPLLDSDLEQSRKNNSPTDNDHDHDHPLPNIDSLSQIIDDIQSLNAELPPSSDKHHDISIPLDFPTQGVKGHNIHKDINQSNISLMGSANGKQFERDLQFRNVFEENTRTLHLVLDTLKQIIANQQLQLEFQRHVRLNNQLLEQISRNQQVILQRLSSTTGQQQDKNWQPAISTIEGIVQDISSTDAEHLNNLLKKDTG